MGASYQFLLGAQRQASSSAAHQRTLAQARRAAHEIARELRFAGGVITREDPSGTTYELAAQIASLELTLVAPNKLRIRVSASATDSRGDTVTNAAEIQIALSNGTDEAA